MQESDPPGLFLGLAPNATPPCSRATRRDFFWCWVLTRPHYAVDRPRRDFFWCWVLTRPHHAVDRPAGTFRCWRLTQPHHAVDRPRPGFQFVVKPNNKTPTLGGDIAIIADFFHFLQKSGGFFKKSRFLYNRPRQNPDTPKSPQRLPPISPNPPPLAAKTRCETRRR